MEGDELRFVCRSGIILRARVEPLFDWRGDASDPGDDGDLVPPPTSPTLRWTTSREGVPRSVRPPETAIDAAALAHEVASEIGAAAVYRARSEHGYLSRCCAGSFVAVSDLGVTTSASAESREARTRDSIWRTLNGLTTVLKANERKGTLDHPGMTERFEQSAAHARALGAHYVPDLDLRAELDAIATEMDNWAIRARIEPNAVAVELKTAVDAWAPKRGRRGTRRR